MDKKVIPHTKGFYINSKGQVFDQNKNPRKTYVNGEGYITATVKTLDNKWVTFGVQRLNAMTHLEKTNPEQTQVNHRDLDVTNNDISNLEWVTPSQNNIHSEIMRVVTNYCSVYSVKNDTPLKRYPNAHEAGKDNDCTALEVWDSIKDEKEVNGVQFRFRPRNKPLPEELRFDRSSNFRKDSRQPPKPVKMLDIDSGDILEFPSLLDAGKYFNVSASHVYQLIPKRGEVRVFLKKYQVQFMDKDFPAITETQIKEAKSHGAKEVIAYNVENQTLSVFKTATEFIKTTKLSKKAVTTSLRNNRLRVVDGWVFIYKNEENFSKLKSYVSNPVKT